MAENNQSEEVLLLKRKYSYFANFFELIEVKNICNYSRSKLFSKAVNLKYKTNVIFVIENFA